MQRLGRWLGIFTVGTVCLLSACTQDLGSGFLKKDEPPQFELQRDTQGRVIRLNKVTGEMVVVNGSQLIPIRQSDEAGRAQAQSAQRSNIPATAPIAKRAESAVAGTSQPKVQEARPETPPATPQVGATLTISALAVRKMP